MFIFEFHRLLLHSTLKFCTVFIKKWNLSKPPEKHKKCINAFFSVSTPEDKMDIIWKDDKKLCEKVLI